MSPGRGWASGSRSPPALDCPEKAREPGSHQRKPGWVSSSFPSSLVLEAQRDREGGPGRGWGATLRGCLVAEPRQPSRCRELGFGFKAPSLPSFLPSLSPSQPLLPSPTLSFLPSKMFALCYEKRQTYPSRDGITESRGHHPGGAASTPGACCSPDGHARGSDSAVLGGAGHSASLTSPRGWGAAPAAAGERDPTLHPTTSPRSCQPA